MKELSIVISINPIMKMKKSNYTFIADPFIFTPSIENSTAGTLFNCIKEITIERPDNDTIQEFHTPRSIILSFRDTFGREIKVGTQDIPAYLSISPNLNSVTLKIECKMLYSPL